MKFFKLFFLSLIVLSVSALWADVPASVNQGVFTSVSGKVQVKKKKKTRQVHKDSTVREGDRIVTGPKSSAVIRLFDGSELSISADSSLGLTKLQKPTETDKLMKFKLFVGRLLAKVQKLASAKSSFEVEAGGVVCGVRGTKFEMGFNPNTGKVGLDVTEGSVWVTSDGQTHTFGAGQQGVFNGHPEGNGHGGQSGGGNGGTGGHSGPGGNGPNGSNGNSGTSGQGGDAGGGSSAGLQDLKTEFNSGGSGNSNKTITDPDVEGSTRVNVHVNY